MTPRRFKPIIESMSNIKFIGLIFLVLVAWLPASALAANAGAGDVNAGEPPVGQPLVREGDMAVKLAEALQLGSPQNEAEAEDMLGKAGITPRNGWIADYPVTPDISGEVLKSIEEAADAGRISMAKQDALIVFGNVQADLGLDVSSYTPGEEPQQPPNVESYANPSVVNNYFYDEGPPVVTYYTPPEPYFYLYTWVPYPFWWASFWFPGYYILLDFDVTIVTGPNVFVCTNHFVDPRTNRVFRIDPVQRFRGRTFAGIGAPRSTPYIRTGIARAPRTIFNRPRSFTPPGGRKTFTLPGRAPSAPRTFRPRGLYQQRISPGRSFTPGRTIRPGRSISPGGGRPGAGGGLGPGGGGRLGPGGR